MRTSSELNAPIASTVIIPAIVQDSNDQKPVSPFYGGALPEVHFKSHPNVNMSIETQLKTPIAATLKPMDLLLYQQGDELSSFFKPQIRLGSLKYHISLKNTNVTASLNHLDETELKWFNCLLNSNPMPKINLEGKPEIPKAWLFEVGHRSLTFNVKTVDISFGLNYLWGLQLKSGL
ncbi:hypothetical protein CEK25_007814 [Fusarium fujikuroi]|nr:hypothetical protein CEK25_007814 [Fusarium fujikuroi]